MRYLHRQHLMNDKFIYKEDFFCFIHHLEFNGSVSLFFVSTEWTKPFKVFFWLWRDDRSITQLHSNKKSHSSEDVSTVLIYLPVIHLHLHVTFPHSSSARQAKVQPQQCQDDQVDKAEKGSAEAYHPITISSSNFLTGESLEEGKAVLSSKLSNSKEVTEPRVDATGPKRRPRNPSSSGEDADRQKTKRSRLGEPAASSDSNNPSSDVAAPDSVCSPQPEISQTNQSRLAASLRGLSVKPISSGSSISSRYVAGEGRKGGEPRTSRLRRLKKSWGAQRHRTREDVWRHHDGCYSTHFYCNTVCQRQLHKSSPHTVSAHTVLPFSL